jgi:DNA-binding NarL/FixJ family response regulator
MNLTTRQAEILELRAKGYSLKEIASDLKISNKTVEYHFKLARENLGVKDQVAACILWRKLKHRFEYTKRSIDALQAAYNVEIAQLI